MSIKIYNSSGVTFSLGPVTAESGRGEDEFLNIEPDDPATEEEAGIDGEVTISVSNNGLATVTVTVKATADSNDGFSVLYNLAKKAPKMAGAIHPLRITDTNGRAAFTGENAWVKTAPNWSVKKKASNNVWEIRVANLNGSWGGS